MQTATLTEIRRIAILVSGLVLILLGALLGPLPGPLGLPIAILGLVLVLRSSRWAKRKYAQAKRRWPRLLSAPDRLLRRRRVAAAPQPGASGNGRVSDQVAE